MHEFLLYLNRIKQLFPIEKLRYDLFDHLEKCNFVKKDKDNNYLVEAHNIGNPEEVYLFRINRATSVTVFEIRIDDELKKRCTTIRITLQIGEFACLSSDVLFGVSKCLVVLYYNGDLSTYDYDFSFLSK